MSKRNNERGLTPQGYVFTLYLTDAKGQAASRSPWGKTYDPESEDRSEREDEDNSMVLSLWIHLSSISFFHLWTLNRLRVLHSPAYESLLLSSSFETFDDPDRSFPITTFTPLHHPQTPSFGRENLIIQSLYPFRYLRLLWDRKPIATTWLVLVD